MFAKGERRRRRYFAVVAAAMAACGGCRTATKHGIERDTRRESTENGAGSAETRDEADLKRLVTFMVGQFSSAEQAAEDPEFREISLKIAPVWKSRTDGTWLYVEQAIASDLEHPYRQRMYRVWNPRPGVFQSDVYSFPDPGVLVGAWRHISRFDRIEIADLAGRTGCSVYLTVVGDRFAGGTNEHDCISERTGAKYATSEADIGADGMATWDRGYDAVGRQVWGAVKGAYRFKKLTDDLNLRVHAEGSSQSR